MPARAAGGAAQHSGMCAKLEGSSYLLVPRTLIPPARNLLAAFARSLLQGQQKLRGVLLSMLNQVLKALHFRQSADAALL